ncbi:MAG: TRC40/GET3/ArsA family transport-energizing ATPase [Chloroflexota bacterium]
MRIILYTGKGGVGKTSVAAATALLAAELGHKTIVMSTDAAHSLSDSLDFDLSGGEPKLVRPNLWAQETEMSQALQAHWDTIREWVASLLAWQGIDEIVADDMAVFPGMEELANLLYITNYYDEGNYDTIIVDCAPTGETLRLLGLPEVVRWWMEKIFPIGRAAVGILRPVVKPLLGVPMPTNEVFDAERHLYEQLSRMRSILTDPDTSSVRLVMNAEKMVIKEAQRTFTYLNLYGYFTDLVVCNRLIPDEVTDQYFDSWKRTQSRHLTTIEECFSPVPVLGVPLFNDEVVGMPRLRLMGKALFDDRDPTQVFFHGHSQKITDEDGGYVLSLVLPFTEKGDISLSRNGDELSVRVGRYLRNILLPRTLVGLPVKGAKFEGELLKVRFEKKWEVPSREATSGRRT